MDNLRPLKILKGTLLPMNNEIDTDLVVIPEGVVSSTPKKGVTRKTTKGRPPKASLKPKPRPVGRPKGDAAIINEYKQRMLASPKSAKVLDSIFNAALNDDHKNQAAAWKLLMDRMLPVSAFEQEIQKNNGKSAITINISGLVSSSTSDQGDTLDIDPSQDAVDGEYFET
jgi:hypothetical protein